MSIEHVFARAASLAIGLICLASHPAGATLSYIGTCANAATQACVVTDGTFEYLSMGGAKVKASELAGLQAQGWKLGSRADFAGMLERNAPLFASDWNDAMVAGTLHFPVSGAALQSYMPQLQWARTGNESIAAAFKDIILHLGGNNANPAYTLTVGTSELTSGDSQRRTIFVQAYYTDNGQSITRNNVFDGVQGGSTRSVAAESTAASNYFLLRSVTAVPEPQTYALLAAGLVLIGTAARKSRNA